MKKIKKLILLGLFLYVSLGASAYDFKVNGIYYNITSSTDLTCKVTYKENKGYNTYKSDYLGKVNVPSSVTYNSKTYSVTSIGEGAFWGCSGLTSIEIPNSVTSIGGRAFYGCSGLTSITIPNIVTSIGDYAFEKCIGLTSIEIPNSVKSIGDYAFSGCIGLTSIEIPNSVKSIGGEAFYNCSGLTSVTISNSVTSIGEEAFYNCSGLTSVTIPNSVTSIGDWAFYYCSGLTSVTIPNSVTSIGSGAFAYCSGLTSVTIGNSVTSIGNAAFKGCNNVKELIYAEGTQKVLRTYLTSITSVTIPNSVTSIGYEAFVDCKYLKSVTMKATTPPTCGSNTFYAISNYTLTVPIGCIFVYKKADVWGDFGTITDGEVQFPTIKIIEEATQTTITLMLVYDKEKCIPFEEIGVKLGSSYYKANSEGIVKFEHLCPNTSGIVYSYAKYGGEYYVSESSTNVRTKPINSELAFSDIMANKAFVRGVYDIGDAHVYKTTFELKIPTEKGSSWTGEEIEYKNDKFTLTGLEPDTEYGVCYTVYYHYGENDEYSGSEYDKQYFTTAKLKMKTLNPKNVSSTSSVVAAEANISDDETGAGFEWRKYDAPESLPSSKGGAIVYDGRMEGKINNLQATYYSVRPYYESASGKVFYGEWITFDPTDFSYFEPTVHTYDFPEDPSSNSVEVRGYVMQGTDDVMEQGFEYWKTGGSSQRKMASNGEVMRVQATGQKMIATLRDLDYESNYVVRAYVVTASGTVYGEERMFTTPADPTSGISEVKESESVSRSLKGIYTLDGRKIERITTPGIYLYNGKKIMFKAGQLPVE